MKRTLCSIATALALTAPLPSQNAAAQHSHGAQSSPPKPPATMAPARPARPTVERPNYRRFDANEPMVDWRAANDRVAQIGGWRAYAKEAAANSANANQATPQQGTKTDGGRP